MNTTLLLLNYFLVNRPAMYTRSIIRHCRPLMSIVALYCITGQFLPVQAQEESHEQASSSSGIHLFILSGQSNMEGLDPAISFTPSVEKALGREQVIVIKDAKGGEPIRRWFKQWQSPEGEPFEKAGDLYDRLMSKVGPAIEGKRLASVTFVWMQGERDARQRWGDVYKASLLGLWNQLRSDLGHDNVFFVLGRLSDFDLENTRYPDWTKVRDAQIEFAESSPFATWVDTDDLNDGKNGQGREIANDLHYSVEGYRELGSRFADAALDLISTSHDASSIEPDRTIVFKRVGDVELALHLFEPAGLSNRQPVPAALFFFGGGWVGGSPSQFYPQSKHLASRGMLAICAEYRTKSQHGTPPTACVEDGKSAMRWAREHAEELNIIPNKIVAAGGSAGGHVACATATLTGFDADGDNLTISCLPNALVLFNPVFDNSKNGYGFERVEEYWESFSPMHNLDRGIAPTIVFLGTKDKLIPVATSEEFQKRMRDLGNICELKLYEDAPHGFFNRGQAYRDTLRETDHFLVEHGFLSKAE